MTTTAELEMPTVAVSPGGTASTTLTVRNDSDIVEAYEFEVVGECAPWSTVEPARISLYPGTSETVTVVLSPPRSPEVPAGEVPLGVRVLPAERPESVVVPETTVFIEAFAQLRAELVPRRRRGWRSARYRVVVHNQGNTATEVDLRANQAGEELRATLNPQRPYLDAGTDAEARLRMRVRKLIWFGKPVTWPFELDATDEIGETRTEEPLPQHEILTGEFVQLPVLPRWLLALLALLAALLVAWFALVRPAVQSAAKEAAEDKTQQLADSGQIQPGTGGGRPGTQAGGQPGTGAGGDQQQQPGTPGSRQVVPGTGQQSSATIDVRTNGGARTIGTYTVPAGKVFQITDLVAANFQGDEGVLTISFGDRVITTIALETFRNQDYHWVTPIEIPENGQVTADVTCTLPGTPASGRQAGGCAELLNVSGALSDIRR